MTCEACEKRRAEAKLLLAATMQWAKAPMGPSLQQLLQQLREAAVDNAKRN